MKTGIELIAEERQRQIEKEGWTPEHDIFEHRHGQLIDAAVSYALTEEERKKLCHLVKSDEDVPPIWPFEKKYWKPCPTDRIKELVKAGALIAAEIDRLQNEKVVCPKCLKPVGNCHQSYPSYHNRIRYICPHCKYDGDSTEFETAYSWHPIHNISKDS